MGNKKMNETNTIKLYWDESLAVRETMKDKKFMRQIVELTDEVWKTYQKNGTVYTCGNGGGAGLVANLAADWGFHPFVSDDKSETFNIPRLKVCNLCADSSMLTAAANDHGYQNVFVEQIRDVMNKNDLVVAFSGSGNSANVLSAFEYANSLGVYTACVSRGDGGKASEIAKINIVIPGTSRFPGQIGKNNNNLHAEDAFVSITHIITGLLRHRVQDANKK